MGEYLSIGIIARNEEHSLPKTLEYIISQDYSLQEFGEIIIVDGNSNDATVEVADTVLRNSGISYKIINERDFNDSVGCGYGHSRARNVMLSQISPKSVYIVRIDADCRPEPYWLSTLVSIMQNNDDPMVAGAGGTRFVEKEGHAISSIEIILNHYFTSYITSLGNPAFTLRDDITHIPSIAGYNSIYDAQILQKYGYNSVYPFNTDDIEINYRLSKAGYTFLYARNARVYHRGAESVVEFLSQMYAYGKGAMYVSLLHFDPLVRVYMPIAMAFVGYTILLPVLILIAYRIDLSSSIILAPYVLVLLASVAIAIEVGYKSGFYKSALVVPLLYGHLFSYGWGAWNALYSYYLSKYGKHNA